MVSLLSSNKWMDLLVTTHEAKYHLSMAGEFFVAAELQRRGVSAAVTYGNAKQADVVAFSATGDNAVAIEVKCTSQPKWVVGNLLPTRSEKPWVFVYLPVDETEAPSYYVLLQSELHDILAPIVEEHALRFKEKNGKEFGNSLCVWSLTRIQGEPFKNGWKRVTDKFLMPVGKVEKQPFPELS